MSYIQGINPITHFFQMNAFLPFMSLTVTYPLRKKCIIGLTPDWEMAIPKIIQIKNLLKIYFHTLKEHTKF